MKIFGVFRMKNHDFTPTNLIFSSFRGGVPPLGSAPALVCYFPGNLGENWIWLFLSNSPFTKHEQMGIIE